MRAIDSSCYKCGSTYETECVRIGMWVCAECRKAENQEQEEEGKE